MRNKFLILIALWTLLSAGLFAQQGAIERLKHNVMVLASDSLMGRGSASVYEHRAAQYLERAFEEIGLEILYKGTGQDFSILSDGGDTLRSQNVVAILEGWDPKLKNEYIVIGAHYDHLGYNDLNVNGTTKREIYRGADDNASGVALMLEVARLAKAQSFNFRRSIVFVAFGAEERGMNGSWYFANRAFSAIERVVLMINLDMVGRGADPKEIAAYTMMPHAQLESILKDVSELPLMFLPNIKAKDYFPSDHQVFANLGIPAVLFTTGMHSDYHTPKDTPEKLNYSTMEHLSHYLLNLSLVVANLERPLPKTILAQDFDHTQPSGLYTQQELEKRATFLKGDERKFIKEWVYHYLKYPAEAVVNGVQGRVVVDFIIETDGTLSNIEVTKSVHPLLDQEAIRVIKASPKWKPGSINGERVRVKMSLPVEFRLSGR